MLQSCCAVSGSIAKSDKKSDMMNSKTLLDMDLHKKKLPDNTSPNSEDHILIIVKEGSRSLAKLKGTTDTYTWIHIEKNRIRIHSSETILNSDPYKRKKVGFRIVKEEILIGISKLCRIWISIMKFTGSGSVRNSLLAVWRTPYCYSIAEP